MSNPYAPSPFGTQGFQQQPSVGPKVNAPSIALMIVASISIFTCMAGLLIDVVLIATGVVERQEMMNQGPVSEQVSITIRIIWSIVLLATSGAVIYGAIQMKNLRNYRSAMTAAIISIIPLLGPCCILGIPFGIWALIVLMQPDVKAAFR